MPKKPEKSKTSPFDSTRFLLLMLFVLVMFISWSIFFAPQKVTSVPVNIVPEKPVVTVEVKNPVPQLKSPTASASAITAQSYYAIDVKTGTQLLAKREEEPQLPASTTKMATALVAMSYYKPDDVLTVGQITTGGHKMLSRPGLPCVGHGPALCLHRSRTVPEGNASVYGLYVKSCVDTWMRLASTVGVRPRIASATPP